MHTKEQDTFIIGKRCLYPKSHQKKGILVKVQFPCLSLLRPINRTPTFFPKLQHPKVPIVTNHFLPSSFRYCERSPSTTMAEKSKVLIIGGTGYIGKFVVKASAKAGHPTFALVRQSTVSDPVKGNLVESFKNMGVTLLFVRNKRTELSRLLMFRGSFGRGESRGLTCVCVRACVIGTGWSARSRELGEGDQASGRGDIDGRAHANAGSDQDHRRH